MTGILRQKLLKLVRGEEGVALVVTLALFMFLYVSCAGVYTVGRAVKDRIILQNAVDAAAYSAAVVQADYLSRIATINKAMAWTYKTLVSSQMDWIASRTLSDSQHRYEINRSAAEPGAIGAYLTPPETMGIRAGSAEASPNDAYVVMDLSRVESLDDLRGRILEYSARLTDMNAEADRLRKGMKSAIEEAARSALHANLPLRLGELCRQNISTYRDGADQWFDDAFADEESFVGLAGESNEKFDTQDWFKLEAGSSTFERSFSGGFETFWKWRDKITHNVIAESFNAKNYRDELPEAYLGFPAHPQVLAPDYLSSANTVDSSLLSGRGIITVAVAKWNENPWKQLVRDLTGIHAAFDHGEKNDWTFAVASAQAGYRSGGDDAGGEVREYSVNGDDFIGKNLGETDWDAVYVPVRMAFADEDDFKDWLTDDSGDEAWELLVDEGDRKYVAEPLEKIKFYELNHKALARMHNNAGASQILKWDKAGPKKFRDLLYH